MMHYDHFDLYPQYNEFSNELFEEEVNNLINKCGERYFSGSMLIPEGYYSTIKKINQISLGELDGFIYEIRVCVDNNMVVLPLPEKVLGIKVVRTTYYC